MLSEARGFAWAAFIPTESWRRHRRPGEGRGPASLYFITSPSWWWPLDSPPLIWVVEDDLSIQRLVSEHLKANNFLPKIFNSAEQAYAALNTPPLPNLIILDMLLPGMSGVDLIRLVKQNKTWEKIPIVVVSVLSREQGDPTLEDETALWVHKPFDAGNLIQTIQNVLMSAGQEKGQS